MTPLRQIFYSLEKLSDKWDPYFDVYERHLGRFVGQQPRVLEIGVQKGGSIHLWLNWFGAGTNVVGLDIDPDCLKLDYPQSVEIVIGDQSSRDFWQQFLGNRPPIDIIIDDGGHSMTQQIVSLECLWNHLAEGGVYICEDTHTSYWPNWGGGFNKPSSFQSYAKVLTDYLNRDHIDKGLINQQLKKIFDDTLNSIHFYNSQIVFEKAKEKPFTRVYSK